MPACEVAPHTGAWIEMAQTVTTAITSPVAPHTGAWIEIYQQPKYRHYLMSAEQGEKPHEC